MLHIFSLIFLALALILTIAYFMQRRRLDPIRVTMTSSIAEVQELVQAFADYTSEKVFRQIVEVKGRVASVAPLIAPLSENACVYYDLRVSWEYEEIIYEEKPGDERLEHKREGEEQLAEERQWQTFFVRDDTGEIAVAPAGCEVIASESLSRHEEDAGLPEETIRCGRFSLEAPWKTSVEERRPLRFHFEEKTIPLGSEIYILAEATNAGGELRLQKPASGGRFLISVKPEEELLRSGQFSTWALLAGAILCGIIGMALLVWA